MGWALDGGEDIGGQLAERDLWAEIQLETYGIVEDRNRRLRGLTGKYVVTTTGISSGKTVFNQDQKVSAKGHWTQFLSNALGFSNLKEAKFFAKKFKFGDPRIAIVTSEGVYQWVNKKEETL